MLKKITYTLYFLTWIIALALGMLFLTEKHYSLGLWLGRVWGLFTLLITMLVLITLTAIYIIKKEKRSTIRKSFFIALSPLIPALIIGAAYFYPKSLNKKEQSITVINMRWACDCANWALREDIDQYGYDSDTIATLCVFIEPADESTKLPEDLEDKGDIRFTGNFYEGKGFPKGYQPMGPPEKARVFRYTKYELVRGK